MPNYTTIRLSRCAAGKNNTHIAEFCTTGVCYVFGLLLMVIEGINKSAKNEDHLYFALKKFNSS